MEVYWAFFGLLFVLILAIKYFKDRELDRKAVTFFIYGLAVLAGGQLLAVLVALGSAQGAIILGSLAATGAGALAIFGLYIELIASRGPDPDARPAAPRPAREAHAPAPAPRPIAAPAPAPRPAAPAAQAPRRPPPPKATQEDDEGA